MNNKMKDSLLSVVIGFFNKFARDIYLPALPMLVVWFTTTESMLQYSVSIFFCALFLARLFWPVLLEKYSLKTVFTGNLLLFILASLFSLAHFSLPSFLIIRFIQGFCVGALPAILRGYIFHEHSTKVSVKVTAFTSALTVIAPSIAVLTGSYLLEHFGVSSITIALIVLASLSWFSVMVFGRAHNTNTNTSPLSLVYRQKLSLLTNHSFMRVAVSCSLISAGLSIYLTVAPFLFINRLGLTIEQFGWVNMMVFTGMLVGKVLAGWIIDYWPIARIIKTGFLLTLLGGLVALTSAIISNYLVIIISLGLALFMCGYGVLLPVCKTAVMTDNPKRAYAATAMIGVIAGLFSAVSSFAVAAISVDDATVLSLLLIALSTVALLVFTANYRLESGD